MSTVKKIVYGFAVFALTVMALAPAANQAQAATLAAGDLIKASGAAVYYYASNGKRYVFPHEKTYKTWYADFSGVKTITDSELAAIQIGGNVVYRPGTRLVKITTDPKVYAVSAGGTLHWITSEAIASALYGSTWAQRVDDVSDAFFTNYTVGADITTNTHPDGSLIKYSGSSDVYVIEAGQKRKVASESAFNANRFNWSNVLTIADTITYANGTDLTGAETKYTDTAQLSSSPAPVTGGSLTVSLAANTPAAMNIPAGTAGGTAASDVPFTAVNFTAGSAAVTLTGLSVYRTGLSVDADLANVKLYDSAKKQLGTSQTFNAEHKAVFTFSKVVNAGATETIWIYADNAVGRTGYIQLGIMSSTDVKSNASAVMGTFPVYGNTMSQVAVNVGTMMVATGPNNPNTAGTIDVDKANHRFMQVRLTAGATEDVELTGISFIKGDNATFDEKADLANMHLVNDNTGMTIGTATFNTPTLQFEMATPIKIEKGANLDLSLRGDVVSGATKIITFALVENGTWLVRGEGLSYGFGVQILPLLPPAGVGVNFGSGDFSKAETANLTINQGKLQVSKGVNCPATGNIAIGGADQKLASWKFTAKGEEVKVGATLVTVTGGGNFNPNIDATLYKLVDSTGKVWAGPVNSVGGVINFTTQMNFPVGETELFLTAKLTGTIGNTAGPNADLWPGDTIQASINTPATALTNVKGMMSNKTVTPSPAANVGGNVMTAQSPKLACDMAATPIAGYQIIGAIGATIATFQLNATAGGEDVKVTALTLTAAAGWNGANTNEFANYKLWDGSTQIGETEEAIAGTDATVPPGSIVFNIDNGYIVPKSEIKKLTVTADALALTNGDKTMFQCTAAVAVGNDSGVSFAPNYPGTISPQQEWKSNGKLKVTLDADTPVAKQLVAGTTGNVVTRYKLEAAWEDVDVRTLNFWAGDGTFTNTPVSEAASNFAAVKVYKGASSTLLGTAIFGTDGKAVLNLDAGLLRVPKDGSEILTIKTDLSEKAVLTSGKSFWIGLGDSDGDDNQWNDGIVAGRNYLVVANGVSSGATIPAACIHSVGCEVAGGANGEVKGGLEMATYDGVLTVSLASGSPSGLKATSIAQEVLRLDLTATGADITVNNIEFTPSGTCISNLSMSGTNPAKWTSMDGASNYCVYANAAVELAFPQDFSTCTTTAPLAISAGTTKTIKLVGDTTGCTNVPSSESLQYSIDGTPAGMTTSGIDWSDGEAANVDSNLTKNLPVYGGTINY